MLQKYKNNVLSFIFQYLTVKHTCVDEHLDSLSV